MPQSTLPPDELTLHGRTELLGCVERLTARFRVPAECVQKFDAGYTIDLRSIGQHWPISESASIHHLVRIASVGEYGTHVIASSGLDNAAPGAYLAVCGWRDISTAVEHLRTVFLGPLLANGDGDPLKLHVSLAVENLQPQERSANDIRLPGWCSTQFGAALRFGPETASKAFSYFNVTEESTLSIVALGANCFAAVATAMLCPEPLRIGIYRLAREASALRDLRRWRTTTLN